MKSYLKIHTILFGLLLLGCTSNEPAKQTAPATMPENTGINGCKPITTAAKIDKTEHVSSPCKADTFKLQLLHFADIDGGRDILNNAVRFSAMLDHFRDQHANTIVLSSGDNWIPGPEYNVGTNKILQPVLGVPGVGRAHVAYLNAMGVEASAVGNHELDFDIAEFIDIISPQTKGDNTWEGATFPYMSANMDFSTDPNSVNAVGLDGKLNTEVKYRLTSNTVVQVNSERIGVVGATTPKLPDITKVGKVTITPADNSDIVALAAEIQASVDQLIDMGINKIILLAHMQQISVETALAPLLRGVDIIVAGGSNTLLADANDRLRDGDEAEGAYPLLFKSLTDEPTVVVNVDGDYTYLGRFVVMFDQNGLMLTEHLDDSVNGSYATDEQGLAALGLMDTDAIPGVQAVTHALKSALANKVGNVSGRSNVYLNGERGSVRTEETNLGNLTADANLDYAQSIEPRTTIAIKNGGGIRAPIGQCLVPPGSTSEQLECNAPMGTPGINNPGDISQLDMEIALRLNNSLTNLTVTSKQLKVILEHSVSATEEGATPGRFPQISGMRFSFDPSREVNSRVVNLVVLDDNGALAGGTPVTLVKDGTLQEESANKTFRVSTLNFLAGGGDGYPFPKDEAANIRHLNIAGQRTGNKKSAEDGTEQDVLAEYLFKHFPADTDPMTPSFNMADLPAAKDQRIQNLSIVSSDTILIN